MSTSDSATAVMTKKNRIFVCTDFTVKSIRYAFCYEYMHRYMYTGFSPHWSGVVDSNHHSAIFTTTHSG